MRIPEKALEKAGGRLGLIKIAQQQVVLVPRNATVVVSAFVTDSVPGSCLAMTQATQKTVLPEGAEVIPNLMRFQDGCTMRLKVKIANPTESPILIPPRGLIGELQEVQIEEGKESASELIPEQGDTKEQTFLGMFADHDMSALTVEQQEQVRKLLLRYPDVFSHHDLDIGHVEMVTHRIDLTDEIPFKQRHRRIPPSMYDEVKDHLQQLLKGGIIRQSNSPWASGVVLVRKKNGKLRFCIDLRQLNNRTIKDAYALPRIEELLDHLKGVTFFTSLDMQSGYCQVEI